MSEDLSLRVRHAAEGARVLALRYLDEAVQAAPRLTNDEDLEALHDFRVGLRRLRSVLRAYRAELRDTVRGKDRDRIGDIASSTNDGRDAEVQLAWLEKRGKEAPPKARAGVDWIKERITMRMHAGYAAARGDMLEHFAKAERKLRECLSYYDLRVRVGSAPRPPSFAEVTSDLLREHLRDLLAHQESIDGPGDEESIHATRIAAKRLRYMVEPLKAELPAVASLVKRLKGMQDVLGDLHDLHVVGLTLAEAIEVAAAERARRVHAIHASGSSAEPASRATLRRDESDGLLWLTAAVRADRDALFSEFLDTWISPHTGERGGLYVVGSLVSSLADELAVREDVEIERKYLLSRVPPQALSAPFDDIDQGYIPGDRLVERVRRVRNSEGEKYYRTVKMGAGVTRTEIEEETSAQIFRGLWALTRGHRVSKRRYFIAGDAGTWELDVFKRRKLALVEIELEREDADVTPPVWLAPCIVREVTDEPEYLNANLAS